MTTSSEARVPHDPADLRLAAKAVRLTASGLPGGTEHADRLEAWADDMERLAPLEAAVLDAAKAWADEDWGRPGTGEASENLADAVGALEEATDG